MIITRMASAVSAPLHSCCTSSLPSMQVHSWSVSAISCPKIHALRFSTLVSQFGYSSWNGLRDAGISGSSKFIALERKKRSKGKIFASLFGVGAPEALVIGVVALLVFGPKGLAEVARNLGKTLREFQPTIRELQDVSREFKSTLEREIGLDDISSNAPRNTYGTDVRNTASTPSSVAAPDNSQPAAGPNGASLQNAGYSNEESVEVTEEQLKTTSTPQQQPLETTATSDDLLRITEEELKTAASQQQQPLETTAYTSDDLLRITEEQLKVAASQQQQPLETTAYTSDDLLRITEEQLKAAASQQQQQTPLSSSDTTSP